MEQMDENDINDSTDRSLSVNKDEPVKSVGELGPVVAGLILNQQLGATILASPGIFVDSGIVLSILLSVLMCLISYYCTIGIIEIDVYDETRTKLSDHYKHYLKNFGRYSYDVFNILLLWPVLIGYIVLLGDLLIPCFELCDITVPTKFGRGIIIILCSTIILFITVTYRKAVPNIRKYNRPDIFSKFISGETFLTCCWFLLVLIIKSSIYIHKHHSIEPTCRVIKADIKLFNSISIYSLCYALPSVFLSKIQLYKINKDDDSILIKRRKIVTFGGIFLVFLFMTVPALMGYLLLGEGTDGNVLNNFSNGDAMIVIMRIAYTISITGSYVFISDTVNEMFLDLFACDCCYNSDNNDHENENENDLSEKKNNSQSVDDKKDCEEAYRLPELEVLQSGINYEDQNESDIENENEKSEYKNVEKDSKCAKIAKTVVAFIISTISPVILATIFPEVKPVLGIAGSLGGCMVDFTLPSALYFIYRRKTNTSTIIQQVLCIFCFVFGFVSAVIATWQAVIGVIDSFK